MVDTKPPAKPLHPQLPLELPLLEEARFDNFIIGSNAELLRNLQQIASGERVGSLYLYGHSGVGRSHLLQSACLQASANFVYLPMRELIELSPDLLAGVSPEPLLCIDDLQCVAGRLPWQEALFHLYNRFSEANCSMVFAADRKVSDLALELHDLASRLSNTALYRVAPLDEQGHRQLITLRASQRGLQIKQDALRFLVSRARRDTRALLQVWERIDQLSLAAGRRVTIPLIKAALNQ